MFLLTRTYKKRLAVSTLILLLLFSFSGVVALADNTAVISAGNVSGSAGETVTVPVTIKDSGGMAGGEVVISYDPEILEIKSIKNGKVLNDILFMDNPALSKNSLKFLWAKAEMVPIREDGEIALLTFFLKRSGKSDLTVAGADLLDINLNEIEVKTESGAITVTADADSPASRNGEGNSEGALEPGRIENGEEAPGGASENDETDTVRPGPAIISLGKVSGMPEETVIVPLHIENPQGMAGGNIVISYDHELVEPQKVKSGGLLSGIIPISNLEHSENTISVAWIGLSGKTSDGNIMEITFLLKDEGVSALELTDLSLVDANGEEIDYETVNGSISIGEEGDFPVNGDTEASDSNNYLYIVAAIILLAAISVFILLKKGKEKRASRDSFFEE